MSQIDTAPTPNGDLALQTFAMPANTNAHGDIFGGWLVSQMDLAGSIAAGREARMTEVEPQRPEAGSTTDPIAPTEPAVGMRAGR